MLEGKRVFLVEDSIVRSTTMKVLLDRIRKLGGAKEIHVRVACPPIVAPCFYGIDMSTIDELFAPRFLDNGDLTEESQQRMAAQLGCDSLRYLPLAQLPEPSTSPKSSSVKLASRATILLNMGSGYTTLRCRIPVKSHKAVRGRTSKSWPVVRTSVSFASYLRLDPRELTLSHFRLDPASLPRW
ncbi:MAG: hypothetical protein R3C56_10460 [Pirellulaceae bacterium]